MAQVRWLPEALEDVERLYAFLSSKNPEAGQKAVKTILEGADMILAAPRIGRLMFNDTQRRELFMTFASGGYVLRYILEGDDTAVIIRVWHSKENKLERPTHMG